MRLTAIVIAAMAGIGLAQAPQLVYEPLDATRPIAYFISDGEGIAGFHKSDRELAVWALKMWEQAAAGAFSLEESPQSQALIRVTWAGPRDGAYGETRRLVVGGRRGAIIFVRPDTTSLGDDISARTAEDALLRDAIVYLTCLHETGHALGLGHTRDFRDIMYSFVYGGDITEYFGRYRRQLKSRNDIEKISALSDGDRTRLAALYPAR